MPLHSLSITELHDLYLSYTKRQEKRAEEGREPLTFYPESRIVRELKSRKAKNRSEQLKIDYCTKDLRNELKNLAFLLSLPVESDIKLPQPEPGREYTPAELTSLISKHAHYRSIAERELQIEYVDKALDLMQTARSKAEYLPLASEIAELRRRKLVIVPAWTAEFLVQAIKEAKKNPYVQESDLVLPLLTLHLQTRDVKHEREAQRIIRRCYRRCLTGTATPADRHVATTFPSYLPRTASPLTP